MEKFTGRIDIGNYQKVIGQNQRTIRNFVVDYVRARKSGISKSKVGGSSDLLSLMFENSNVYKSEDDVVDLLFDIFCTGQLTS